MSKKTVYVEDYQIKDDKIEELLKDLGRRIKEPLPKGWGFMLMLLDSNDGKSGGATFYISDMERQGMIETLEEFVEKQKAGRDV